LDNSALYSIRPLFRAAKQLSANSALPFVADRNMELDNQRLPFRQDRTGGYLIARVRLKPNWEVAEALGAQRYVVRSAGDRIVVSSQEGGETGERVLLRSIELDCLLFATFYGTSAISATAN
jgi:hypothetical protein